MTYFIVTVSVLIALTLLRLVSCQTDCAYPTTSDIENVIQNIFISGDNPTLPRVIVSDFHLVCLAYGEQRDRYKYISAVVEYTCSRNGNCPTGSVLEQIEFGCNGVLRQWTHDVLGITENTRTTNPTATFSTDARGDCAFCLSPALIRASGFGVTTDPLTHCSGT